MNFIDPNIADGRSLYIAGRWDQGSGETLRCVNPATGEVTAMLRTAGAADLDRAVQSAREALQTSGWARMVPHRRADHLHAISRLLGERADALGAISTMENGKTLAESCQQVRGAAGIFRFYAGLCETLGSEVTPARGDYVSFTTYEPWGVAAAITPWNSPVNLAAEKIAPALAAGNAVILKPSELTPIVSLELGKLCVEAGLPPGLVNVVPGTADTSAALVRHAGIDMISFTGGVKAGRAIAAVASERLIPVVLELGGKSANIVMQDADLGLASAGISAGIFGSLGQSCIAGSRVFIHESVRPELVEMLVHTASSLRLGPPGDPGTQLGPLASFPHRDHVARMVDGARQEGGRILAGGTAPEGATYAKGAYYRPTLIDGLPNSAATCQTEIFGPVACLLPFSDEEDLVRQANDTMFGLACGVWSRNFDNAWRVARQMKTGTVWVNTYRQNSVATPFGGFKQSGLGRERGVQGLRAYQQVKSIFLGTSDKPLNFDR